MRRHLLSACFVLAFLCCNISANAQEGSIFLTSVEMQSCGLKGCRVYKQYATSFCIGKINNEWILVTAGHTFHGEKGCKNVVRGASVSLGGKWGSVRIIAYSNPDGPRDIAWLALSDDHPAKTLCLAASTPAAGVKAKVCGFPSAEAYNTTNGYVHGAGSKERKLRFGPAVVRGYSGSPVIESGTGKVIGLVSASDFDSETCCLSVEQIRESAMIALHQIPDCGEKPNPAPKWDGSNEAPSPPEEAPSPPPEEKPPQPKPDPISNNCPDSCPKYTRFDQIEEHVKALESRFDKLESLIRELKSVEPQKVDLSKIESSIEEFRISLNEIKNRKLPDIPMEIYDKKTGELLDEWTVPLGQPIQLDVESEDITVK